MRLLLLEDDPDLGAGLREFLQAEGYAVDWYRRLVDIDRTQVLPYDALLLDWRLPDGSGLDWLRSLRQAGDTTPALLLTARDLLDDRVRGLDAGADDYLVKPFDPEELCARLRAIMRRLDHAGQPRVACGDVEIDLEGRTAWLAGTRVKLTAREWTLLQALTSRSGRPVARAELEALVLRPHGDAASNALEVHVSSLRRKLGRRRIETIRGLGYRIVP